ncbi:MAG: histidine phosphatase family protein [Desulfovibrionaceae bacterium]|nr:histidine phosphatase family protein [Desulfovibrionaceae bacterium]
MEAGKRVAALRPVIADPSGGALDPDLTPDGCRMAEDFSNFYESLPRDAVHSSSLLRTVAMAKHLCDAAGI